jgi:hypothetical protein
VTSSSRNAVSFHPRERRNAFSHRDARPQSKSFASWNQPLRHSPELQPALLSLSAMISQ